MLHNLNAEKVLLPLSGMLSLHPENFEAEYKLICFHIPDGKRCEILVYYACTCIRIVLLDIEYNLIIFFMCLELG